VFDETRNRFVYPQDRSLTVYFEWEATPGDHVLTATWRQPDGRIVSVSPDVKIQTTSKELNCYWIFSIAPTLPNGTWTVEIRVDGQPAGSHAFELAGLESTNSRFTLDRAFRTYGPAVVMVYKLDSAGRRMDASSGFVIAPNAVATAFQSIDAAPGIEVEFADGLKFQGSEVLAVSRLGDWAVLAVDTRNIVPIPRGDSQPVAVGSQLSAFSLDAGTRVIVPINIGAVSPVPGYGTRIRFSPALSPESAGGPVIDERGSVVGILGGSLTPGSRVEQRAADVSPWLLLLRQQSEGNSATAVTEVPLTLPAAGKTLSTLKNEGILTTPLSPMPEFLSGGATTQLPKDVSSRDIRNVTEFSARDDAQIAVYTYWMKRAKLSKGELSATVFDATNRIRGTIPSTKVSLDSREHRFSFTLSPKALSPGYYRVDVCWDGKPAWRTYLRILD
jgi:hypothetical protein